MKKILLGLGLLSAMVLVPHSLYAGATRIIEADQIRSGAALLSLPTATQTIVGTTQTQTLTNKTLTSPSISSPTGLVKGDVGLGNVDNTSDATKNSATATLTNKTLTSPVINTPTGIVKGDVGLGNVDNTSDATKNAASVQLTNKDIDGGTASNTSRITLPKNTLSSATSLTRKEGTIIYVTDQAKPYYDTGSSLVAVGSGSGGGASGYNTIQNTDAETDTSNWTESGGTFTRTNTSGELLFGAYSFKWTPSAAQNLRSSAVTIVDGLYGRNCYAQVIYKTASTDYTMQVLDGSNNVLASYAMPAASTAKIAPINFVCPLSGSMKLGFVTTASAVQLDFDSAFLGEATNITTSTNVTDWVSYTPTFTGFGTPSSVEFQSRRVGSDLEIRGKFVSGTSTATEARISLGYNGANSNITSASTSAIPSIQISGYGQMGSSSTTDFSIRPILIEPSVGYLTFGAARSTANGMSKQNGNVIISNGETCEFFAKVPISGWSAEPAFRPDLAAVNWSGKLSGGTKWTTASSSFVDVTSSGWSLATTSSSNLSVSQYSTNPGITFTPPHVGRYDICFAGAIDNATSGSISAIKLTDGTTDIVGEIQANASGAAALLPVSGCGTLNITSLSAINIRAQLKAFSGTAEFGNGGAITFTVKAVDQGFPAPILIGSVTNASTGAIKHEAAQITVSNSAAAVVTQMGSSWVSVSNGAGAGLTTATISGFSAAPACQCTVIGAASTSASWCGFTSEPSSTTLLITRTRAGAAENGDVNITCTGPK